VSGDIWAAIAGGANYIGQQQKDAQDEERWQQRYEFMRQQQMKDEKAKQRFLMSIRPPETRKVNTTDTAGKPIVRTEEWRLNGDKGAWANVGEAPDVNFERLQETTRHNQESEQLRSDANQARTDAATARLGLERERLENAKGRSGGAGRLIRQVMPDGSAVYGTVQDGKFSPVTDEEGNPLNTTAWRPRQGKPGEGDAIGPPRGKVQPVFVDPSEQRPMSQFQPKAKPQAAPAPAPTPGGQHGKVVRTGTKNGRRVVMYEDGTIEEQ
jgi:hypothetical protein